MFNSKISKVSLSCEEIQCRQEKNAIKRKDPNTDEATEKVIGSLPTHTRKIFYRFYDFQASKKKMTVFLKGIEEDFSFDIRSLIIGRLLMEGGSKKELRQSISEWIKKAKNKDKNKNKKLFEDVLLCLTAVSENSVPPTTLREETCKLAEEHTSRKLYLRKFYER